MAEKHFPLKSSILCGYLDLKGLKQRDNFFSLISSLRELTSKIDFKRKILSSLTFKDFLRKFSNFFSTLP